MPSLVKKRSHVGDAPGDQQSTLKMRRSCDACALAKRRCDGELRCSLCCKKSIRCVYSTRQKSGPKGHKTPGESVAATVTTSISSTTTADKPIKRCKTSKKPSKKQASAAAAPSTTTTGWQQHQRQQSSLLKTVPPGKSEPITPAALALSATAAVAPASPSLSKRQQPAAPGRRYASQQVARKEPRLRHQRKDEAAEETAGAKFAPLPRMVPRRGSSVSAPGSESSVDGSSSSLSWDDVQDVFVSSLEDDVLWSCDDFSDDDRAEGWAAAGVASDDHSPGGFDWLPLNAENVTPSSDLPKALEAILMAGDQESVLTTDQTATTAAPRPAGQFAGQPPPSMALAPQEPMMSQMLPSRASSPSVVFAQRSPGAGGSYGGGGESSGGWPPSTKISDDVEPVVVNVLPTASGSSSSSSGMLQNSLGGISDTKAADCGDGACSPISAWTPEAVVAGASTLLAVLSDADFCSGVRSDILTGGNGWGVERRHQQHQHQHNDDSSTRWSWPPRNLGANYSMVPRSPPAATPTVVADGSWHSETTATTDGVAVSEKKRRHYYHRQQQQQQQQRLALAPPDIRSLVKELSTPSDGGGTTARGGKGSKRYRTATL
ncbi:conserved unknown protein [Ectocarpus siliculosus]|uniref:Zn(2)-C6 fungal-type domain-containing protein n=1 Tax=Ectocarpus siliculosus TaxID=2880 RepID=D7G8Z3_ECTSI|nr:conserved unknown protein [Ectocarpus siliculosus]|eukprot:CBJ28154.1 conserved unknown protein [Ectocarpus siliculosus]